MMMNYKSAVEEDRRPILENACIIGYSIISSPVKRGKIHFIDTTGTGSHKASAMHLKELKKKCC